MFAEGSPGGVEVCRLEGLAWEAACQAGGELWGPPAVPRSAEGHGELDQLISSGHSLVFKDQQTGTQVYSLLTCDCYTLPGLLSSGCHLDSGLKMLLCSHWSPLCDREVEKMVILMVS